mmetsp:Transcript_26991/g.77293  ORF Transcript_26991/g.77293 Transcript_26991/m.77293 type:complete len:240 (-) Transcript_26991:294-1013(-)
MALSSCSKRGACRAWKDARCSRRVPTCRSSSAVAPPLWTDGVAPCCSRNSPTLRRTSSRSARNTVSATSTSVAWRWSSERSPALGLPGSPRWPKLATCPRKLANSSLSAPTAAASAWSWRRLSNSACSPITAWSSSTRTPAASEPRASARPIFSRSSSRSDASAGRSSSAGASISEIASCRPCSRESSPCSIAFRESSSIVSTSTSALTPRPSGTDAGEVAASSCWRPSSASACSAERI